MRYITILLLLLLAAPFETLKASDNDEVDVNELVFGHIGDAYEWHIATLGENHLSIPLPVIVKSQEGWKVFSSAQIKDGKTYQGLYIARGGAYDGKVVEKSPPGEEVRPFDLSITKNVLGLMINSTLMVIILLSCVRWYKKHPVEQGAPKGE